MVPPNDPFQIIFQLRLRQQVRAHFELDLMLGTFSLSVG